LVIFINYNSIEFHYPVEFEGGWYIYDILFNNSSFSIFYLFIKIDFKQIVSILDRVHLILIKSFHEV